MKTFDEGEVVYVDCRNIRQTLPKHPIIEGEGQRQGIVQTSINPYFYQVKFILDDGHDFIASVDVEEIHRQPLQWVPFLGRLCSPLSIESKNSFQLPEVETVARKETFTACCSNSSNLIKYQPLARAEETICKVCGKTKH